MPRGKWDEVPGPGGRCGLPPRLSGGRKEHRPTFQEAVDCGSFFIWPPGGAVGPRHRLSPALSASDQPGVRRGRSRLLITPFPGGFSLLQTTSLQDSMASSMSSSTLPRGLNSQPVSTPDHQPQEEAGWAIVYPFTESPCGPIA